MERVDSGFTPDALSGKDLTEAIDIHELATRLQFDAWDDGSDALVKWATNSCDQQPPFRPSWCKY